MYGRKKTASRRLPAYNILGRQSESRCVRDGRECSAGVACYLCLVVKLRCRDTDRMARQRSLTKARRWTGRVSAILHLFEPQAHQASAATHTELAIDVRDVGVRG